MSPELAPFGAPSATSSACAALAKALVSRDHRVTAVSPLYGSIDPMAHGFARRLRKIKVELGGEAFAFEVYDGRSTGGVDLLFLGHEELFRGVEAPELVEPALADARRFALFSMAAIEVVRTRERRPERVHAHGWAAALVPILLAQDETLEDIPSVLTIHDVREQGRFPASGLWELGLSPALFEDVGLELGEEISWLEAGIAGATGVSTVSPTYARKIAGAEGAGLEDAVRRRGRELVGILNGVDASIFNPASDPHLDSRYTPEDRRGKATCKRTLQKELGLALRADVPLFGAFGELELDEGYGALLKLLPRFLRNDVQVVLGGEGDPDLITAFEELSNRWPERLQLIEGDHRSLHRLLGASDFFVVPTPYAPCGSRHMEALRYGAVPIVRDAGGMGDAVVNCDARAQSGTGFLYEEEPREGLLGAMQRAATVFADSSHYGRLCRRAMLTDLSWERAAYLYERLYQTI